MLKFVNSDIVFQEIPDEVTLAVNISNCPCHCPGCHSKFLWADVGNVFDEHAVDSFMDEFGGSATCLCFMGGDTSPRDVNALAAYVKRAYPTMKTGWYTGRTVISSEIDKLNFDYIKVGPYIAHLGPLKNPRTNQRLYKVDHENDSLVDITSTFWKKR